MGNIGRPSSGCSRCRRRRVKCDERRPGCVRCEKLQEKCPGYSQDAWVFRDENDVARRRALRLKRTDELETASSVADSSGMTSSLTRSSNSVTGSVDGSVTGALMSVNRVQQSLQTDLELRSVCLFMETFTLDSTSEGSDPAYMDYLPQLYLSSSGDSCLRKAVTAVAQTVFMNRYGAHDLLPSSVQAYGKALAATNKALADPSTALSDSTLTAVSLLGLYELICRPSMQMKAGTAWLNHVDGILHLIRLRGQKQFDTVTGRQLYRLNWGPIMTKYMMLHQEIPQEFVEVVRYMACIDHGEDARRIVESNFFYEATSIRFKLRMVLQQTDLDPETFSEQVMTLITQAEMLQLDNCFESWAICVSHWQPQVRTAECETDRIYFSSHFVLNHWLQYWGTKLSLQITVVNSLLIVPQHCPEDVMDTSSSFRRRIMETADLIIGSVAFALGKLDKHGEVVSSRTDEHQEVTAVGGLHLFWPVGVVKHSAFTTTAQKQIATDILRQIGTSYLIAQALIHL